MIKWGRLGSTTFFNHASDYKGEYLSRLIWLGCISACIPVIIGGIIYYQTSMGQMYKQIRDDSQVSLTLIADRMDRILGRVEQESLNLAMDPMVRDIFFSKNIKQQVIGQKQILDTILQTKSSNDLVSEILLYNAEASIVLSNEYGNISYEDYRFRNDLASSMEASRKSQWVVLPEAGKNGYISFTRSLPMMSLEKANGAIVFHTKEKEMNSYLLDSLSFVPGQGVVVLDQHNRMILHSKKRELLGTKPSDEAAIARILAATDKTGNFFFDDTAGESMLYTYTKSSWGRTYIATVPKQEIDKRMSWVRWVIIFTVLLLLGIGVLISYINSRRAYSPIYHLIKHGKNLSKGRISSNEDNELSYIRECLNFLNKESEQLSDYLTTLEPGLRERFFHKLLENGYGAMESLHDDCQRYDISITGNYMVLVADVEHYYREKRFMPKDKPIVNFAIANVMEELLNDQPNLTGYVVNFNQSRAIAILYDCNKDSLEEYVLATKQYGGTVCEALNQYMKLKVSVGIGKVYSHAADISVSFREALMALQFRMHRDSNPVLYIEDLEVVKGKTTVFYPRTSEKAILASLSTGAYMEAEHELKIFADTLNESQIYNFIYQSYHILLSSIVDSLEQRGVSIVDILENNLFDQLKERQTQTEMYDWFVDVCFPLYKNLVEQIPEESVKMEVIRVCQYIKDHIQTDISLTKCSELVGMSPSYLSRLFKKEMDISFVEYVITCKMKEAQRLLLETEYTVNQIATLIGYSERNLSRIFQRYMKQTPASYRNELS